MTWYEITRLLAAPFLPVLHGKVRRALKKLVHRTASRPVRILDVGARKSPYTIGLPAQITLLDIPQEGEVMKKLNLGFTSLSLEQSRHRRSNIEAVHLQDMTQSTLSSASFDGVVCVEVIEHILEVEAFVAHIVRVLKPGSWAYFTTPNGDYIKNEPPHYNPDHVRHFTRAELAVLLGKYFEHVAVTYGVKTGKYRYRGLRGISLRSPLRGAQSVISNVISHLESRGLDESVERTAHLFAVAWKKAVS
ncbi:MAG: class I SAM-dependent methyltransferase [Rhodothermales bacterium]